MTLPTPGPGRPHHRSYSEPSLWSAEEIRFAYLVLAILAAAAGVLAAGLVVL